VGVSAPVSMSIAHFEIANIWLRGKRARQYLHWPHDLLHFIQQREKAQTKTKKSKIFYVYLYLYLYSI